MATRGANFFLIPLISSASCLFSMSDAQAWRYEEFYSGMSEANAEQALSRRGYQDLLRVPLSGKDGVYILQNRSMNNKYHVSICGGVVYEISVDVGSDFPMFASRVESEKSSRGEPRVTISQSGIYSFVWAEWNEGADQFQYIFQWDLGDKNGGVGMKYSAPGQCTK